ncbi:hypothetical protein JOE44_000793 [Chryseobacterium sp. PvR013]|nr:hypothetical protein [Chryseobacterium sp. PvR013]
MSDGDGFNNSLVGFDRKGAKFIIESDYFKKQENQRFSASSTFIKSLTHIICT